MPRYKLTIEYDGTSFAGWQRQKNILSVQEALEEAFAAFLHRPIRTRAAGRTDSGVHARGQVVHADLPTSWPNWRLRDALNAHLRPRPCVVLNAEEVPPHFDARFSALSRHYMYHIINRPTPLALYKNRAWHIRSPLDVGAMEAAAAYLTGKHDFSTFRASSCQANSPIRTLDSFTFLKEGDNLYLHTSARSFLHHQVRSMVGSLEQVGIGKWTVEDFYQAFTACDRHACGRVAPPEGLYFMKVEY